VRRASSNDPTSGATCTSAGRSGELTVKAATGRAVRAIVRPPTTPRTLVSARTGPPAAGTA
jgi:hypothetical protein